MFLAYVKISWLMMRARPVRSILSLVGIYIGVGALVIILSIREGVRRQLDAIFETHGARVVYVNPGFDEVTRRIGELSGDQVSLLQTTPGVRSVLPRTTAQKRVRSASGNLQATIVGIDDQFVPIYRMAMIRGRAFLPEESELGRPVCLIAASAVRALFPYAEPLGSTIEIDNTLYEIVGIVNFDSQTRMRTSTPEAHLFVPARRLAAGANTATSMLEVRLHPDMAPAQASKVVREALSRGHKERETLYFVRSPEEYLQQQKSFTDRIMAALLAIASISLIVGGIGIANVMITSVTERTREVGIRKAVGARRRDILFQFLVESSILSAAGGLLAILTGAVAVPLVAAAFAKLPLALAPGSALACLILTMAIGLIAGLYPASRAAALPPADALRYE